MHKPFILYQADIDLYLADKVVTSWMSSPFSLEEVTLLRGPFQCSPIVGKLHICHHLSKTSKEHVLTNSFIDTEKFLARFRSATDMAEIMSPFFPLWPNVVPHYFIPYLMVPCGTPSFTCALHIHACPTRLCSLPFLPYPIMHTYPYFYESTNFLPIPPDCQCATWIPGDDTQHC